MTMQVPLDYVDYQVAVAPAYQQAEGSLGQSWNQALGLTKDLYGAGMRLAVKCRFPEFAPADALDGIGATLQIDRLYAQNDQAYIAALMSAWSSWSAAGTVPGMMAQLQAFGLANVALWEAWYWSDGNPGYYFTVTCSLPMPWNSFPMADGTWGDGFKTWTDGGIWASGIPWPTWRKQLKAVITKWKPAHAVCAAVIVNLNSGGRFWGLSGGTYGDGHTWAGGTSLYINMTV